MAFSTVAIVGSGAGGCGVALACAARGVAVTLIRAVKSQTGTADRLSRRLAVAIDRGEIDPAERARIVASIAVGGDLSACADAELVIDATSCDPKARRALLATLETRLTPGAVLATCAPPERLAEIAEALRRPDQLVGLRLVEGGKVELSVLPETAPGVVAACRAFVADLGTTPIERASEPPRIGYREFLVA
jgi:3-hydroxyacyl-CoA dehydrogenase